MVDITIVNGVYKPITAGHHPVGVHHYQFPYDIYDFVINYQHV